MVGLPGYCSSVRTKNSRVMPWMTDALAESVCMSPPVSIPPRCAVCERSSTSLAPLREAAMAAMQAAPEAP